MDINKFFESKLFKRIVVGIVLLASILFILKLGIFIGSRRADFAFKWGENYHKNFAGPRQGFFNEFMGQDFIEGNGAFGQIIKIDGQTLVVKDAKNIEKVVLIKDDTTIVRFRDTLKLSDLRVDDNVVIIGNPNDVGQIEAELIRLMPPPPETSFNPNDRMMPGGSRQN